MQYVPALPSSSSWQSREEEEEGESLALVAIETNSSPALLQGGEETRPCLPEHRQDAPLLTPSGNRASPGPVCLTRCLLVGRKGPRVSSDRNLFGCFFPKEGVTVVQYLDSHWGMSGEHARVLSLHQHQSLMLPVLLRPAPEVCQGGSLSAAAGSSVRLQHPLRPRYSAPYSASGMPYRDC